MKFKKVKNVGYSFSTRLASVSKYGSMYQILYFTPLGGSVIAWESKKKPKLRDVYLLSLLHPFYMTYVVVTVLCMCLLLLPSTVFFALSKIFKALSLAFLLKFSEAGTVLKEFWSTDF